jgi:hypothetical protein
LKQLLQLLEDYLVLGAGGNNTGKLVEESKTRDFF